MIIAGEFVACDSRLENVDNFVGEEYFAIQQQPREFDVFRRRGDERDEIRQENILVGSQSLERRVEKMRQQQDGQTDEPLGVEEILAVVVVVAVAGGRVNDFGLGKLEKMMEKL